MADSLTIQRVHPPTGSFTIIYVAEPLTISLIAGAAGTSADMVAEIWSNVPDEPHPSGEWHAISMNYIPRSRSNARAKREKKKNAGLEMSDLGQEVYRTPQSAGESLSDFMQFKVLIIINNCC